MPELTPCSPLLDMETPLHRLRGLALLLDHMGSSGHVMVQDAFEALSHALEAVHVELQAVGACAGGGARDLKERIALPPRLSIDRIRRSKRAQTCVSSGVGWQLFSSVFAGARCLGREESLK